MVIYPNEPFYVVTGFKPASGRALDRFGFAIGLSPKIAKIAIEKEISEKTYKHFDEIGKKIIKLSSTDSKTVQPYRFVKNKNGNLTALLHACYIFGESRDLGLDGMQLGSFIENGFDSEVKSNRLIEYNTHNVDSPRQAYQLLSLWTNWADTVFALTSE